MLKKIILGFIALILILVVGVIVVFQTKGDFILEKFSAYVKESTGAPLSMAALPKIVVFPVPGLDIGQATWGEGTPASLSFTSAKVRISASALLSGTLNVTSIEVDGLNVDAKETAAKAPAGAEKTDKPAMPDQANQANLPNLATLMAKLPENVVLKGANLVWKPQKGDAMKLGGLNATLERSGSSLTANLGGNWQNGEKSADVKLSAKALVGSAVEFTVSEASVTPGKGMPWQGKASLKTSGTVDLQKNVADVRELALNLPGFSLNAKGKATDIFKNPAFAGEFNTQGALRSVLDDLGLVLPLKPDALKTVNIAAAFSYSPVRVEIKSLKGTVDATTLDANLVADLAANRLANLTLNLNADQINLDNYLQGETAKAAQSASASTPKIQGAAQPAPTLPQKLLVNVNVGRFSGMGASAENIVLRASGSGGTYTLTQASASKAAYADKAVENFSAAGSGTLENFVLQPVTCALVKSGQIQASNISATVTGKNGVYSASPLTATVFGSALKATLGWNSKSGETKVTVNAPTLDIRQALTALANKNFITGTGALNADLTLNSARPMDTLSGTAALDSTNIVLDFDLIPAEAKLVAGVDQNRLSLVKIRINAQNGLARFSECVLTGRGLGATATGTVALPTQTLDIAGKLTIDRVGIVPVRLTGPISSPKYALDPKAGIQLLDSILRQSVKGAESAGQGAASEAQTLEQKLGKEVGKGLNRLFEKIR